MKSLKSNASLKVVTSVLTLGLAAQSLSPSDDEKGPC
jgi:hypothetical protein